MLVKIEGKRRRGQQRMRWLDGCGFEETREMQEDREAWHVAVHGVTRVGQDLVTEHQQSFLPGLWVCKKSWASGSDS